MLADLREVASDVLPVLATPGLRLDVVQRSGAGSVVVLEEERHLRVHLDELADDMTRAGVAPTRDGISAALSSWVAHRPVTDAAMTTSGIAVLDWQDRSETAVGWRVVVRRGSWHCRGHPRPPRIRPAYTVARSAATGQAHDVRLDLRVGACGAVGPPRGPDAGRGPRWWLRSGCSTGSRPPVWTCRTCTW